MSQFVHYTHCPVCGAAELKTAFSVTDHSVSGEKFPILECNHCTLRLTQDIPTADFIGPYYRSEDYISHTNSSKGLINQLYRQVRKITLRQKRKFIENSTGLSSGNLLDIGSGTGAFAAAMKQAGWKVTGLEPDEGARKVANDQFGISLDDTGSFFELPPSQFDVITLWHVLEHVHDLQAYVQQLQRLLKPGGKLLIAVPNYTSGDARYFGINWAAYDVPRHLYHFSPPSIRILLERNSLKLLSVQPMWFDSFYVSMLSTRYASGKVQYLKAVWQGLLSNLNAIRDRERCSSLIYVVSH